MTPPILPPTPLQSIAYLQPGDKLQRATVVQAAHIIVRRGKYQAEVLFIALDNGMEYCELPTRHQFPMSDLVRQLIPRQEPYDGSLCPALREMQERAGFTLYPGQARYLYYVSQVSGALLAASVGCGKTLLSIALIELLKPLRCLIIAPQGVITARGELLSQWEAEFKKYAPWLEPRRIDATKGGVSFMIQFAEYRATNVWLTYMQEALANNGGWLQHLNPDYFDMIIVDEAHLLQNHETVMGKALYRMNPARRYALTATPIGNRVEDCCRLVSWLQPGIEAKLPYVKEQGSQERPLVPLSPLLTYRSKAHAIAPIRKKDIRPDLPPLHIHKVYVEPDAETLAAYRDIEANFTLKKGGAGQIERVRLTKLRNVCAMSKAKAERIGFTVVAESVQRKCVITSARIEQTNLITRSFHAHLRLGRIDSTVNPKKNAEVAAAFQRGELDVLMLGIKCAYGYSFPECDTIHVASLEWNWGTFDQAIGRVHRVNSQKTVHAYVYLLKGTIEERMFDTVCTKQSAAALALYGEAAS